MPNCDFYATGNDINQIVGFIFSELDCRVFESDSIFGKDLKEFKSLDELKRHYPIGKCKKNGYSALLQMWPVNASETVFIKKIKLDPKSCNGFAHRYRIEGWGLIQLYLGGRSELGLVHSHTNHNSKKRAEKWATTLNELGSPKKWDWKEVTRISSKLNRQIRKLSINKIGGRPVLQEAEECLSRGIKAL